MLHLTVLDSLSDAIVVGDLGDRIVHINPAAERLLGWTSAELEGRPLTLLMPERMHVQHTEGVRRFAATRTAKIMGKAVRVPALRKDGSEIDIELTLSTFELPGEAPAVIATMRDLAERVELERQLQITRYLRAATDGVARLTERLDVDHVVRTAAVVLVEGFDAALARVWLPDSARGALILRASAGLSEETHGTARAVLDLKTYPFKVGVVARTLEPFVSNDLTTDSQFDQDWLRRENIKAVAVFPLAISGQLRGVIASFFRRTLADEIVQSLLTFAALTASAVNDSLLHEAERATRKRFEDFVNGIDHGIVWEADAATLKVTFVSARAEQLLGYPLADWYSEGHFWIDRVHHDDRDGVLRVLRAAVASNADVGFEHRFVKANGEVVWVHTGARLAQVGPGSGVMIHALSADVTHLKASEERAAAAARQLDTILGGVAEGVTAQAADGRLLYANLTSARLCGFSSTAEMMAASPADIAARFHLLDESGNPFPSQRAPWRLALEGVEPPSCVIRFRDLTTNVERWSIASARPVLAPDGTVEMVIGVFRDVTDEKRVENGLRFLSDASVVLATSLEYEETLRSLAHLAVPAIADWCSVHLLADDDAVASPLIVHHVDPEKVALARELIGKYPPDPSASRGAAHVMRTGKAELYAEISDAQLEGAAIDGEHLRLLRALGMISAMTVPISARGRVMGAISFIAAESGRRYGESDLNIAHALAERAAYAVENAQLYAEAQRARAHAEEATRLKDEFLTTVSHELRTPLSSILGWSAMLRGGRRSDPAFTAQGLEVIERNARSQLRIIEDILDVSRIIRGQLRLETQPVRIDELAREVLQSLRPSYEAKRIRADYRGCDGECLVVADPDRLRQVLWNLVSNAVKFTPASGEISVAIEQVGAEIIIAVRDTGIGIEKSFLPFVFERFRQADGSAARPVGGLGLGLAIVRHLVELHGGTIAAQSDGLGTGATFIVKLPIRPFTTSAEELRETAAAPNRKGARSDPPRALSGMRLLVVEDESDSRELIEIVLASEGASVMTTSTAEEALAALDAFAPDVLVSDIGMPEQDGYWLVAELRKRRPTLPTVALTAFTRREDVARILRAGFDEHVGKPVDPQKLVETIAALRVG